MLNNFTLQVINWEHMKVQLFELIDPPKKSFLSNWFLMMLRKGQKVNMARGNCCWNWDQSAFSKHPCFFLTFGHLHLLKNKKSIWIPVTRFWVHSCRCGWTGNTQSKWRNIPLGRRTQHLSSAHLWCILKVLPYQWSHSWISNRRHSLQNLWVCVSEKEMIH